MDTPKKGGLNQFHASPFELTRESFRRSSDALNLLVRPEQLSVVFQPIVSLASMKTVACEALLRCSMPGYESPPRLFAEAVAQGCVGRLGRMVREVAVELSGGMPLFLNVHPGELEQRWLVQPDDPLYRHDAWVYLEITESVPLQHWQLCETVLREVRRRGQARVVVDDFGAGYSNLRYIADLEPEVVKLDRMLLKNLHESTRRQSVVRAVVTMCHDLGARVVAEGIETRDELKAVMDCGADLGQGYLFAKPAYPLPSVKPPFDD